MLRQYLYNAAYGALAASEAAEAIAAWKSKEIQNNVFNEGLGKKPLR